MDRCKKGYLLGEKDLGLVFNVPPYEDSKEDQIGLLKSKDVNGYRLKSIFSGEILESEGYPIWDTRPKNLLPSIAKLKKTSSAVQKSLNQKNTRKKIVRLINSNFTSNDIWITVGYVDADLPADEKAAKRDVINYLRRLQRYCANNNLPKLKYLYITEFSNDPKRKVRVHHHIVMNFQDRDLAEKMWKKGKYPQARRLSTNDYGLEGLARYISKDPKGSKSYGYSINLHKSWVKPHAKTADRKLSRRRASLIAMDFEKAKEFYEKTYPDYKFLDLEVRYSDFCSGCYLYCRMKKKE